MNDCRNCIYYELCNKEMKWIDGIRVPILKGFIHNCNKYEEKKEELGILDGRVDDD